MGAVEAAAREDARVTRPDADETVINPRAGAGVACNREDAKLSDSFSFSFSVSLVLGIANSLAPDTYVCFVLIG